MSASAAPLRVRSGTCGTGVDADDTKICARIASVLLAFALLGFAPLVPAARLVPLVSSGLASPLFVTHAGDGTNRLFIVERDGVVKVLQPGASAPTVFLDIRDRLIAGGERGLLGLAFHPDYPANGRLFVFYTRSGDGALVIAEYARSADPDAASPGGRVLLTIDHPGQANHNGGMLAFGPDRFLYIGVGDGGGGNDPLDHAQNTGSLLGKILRIDIDRQDPLLQLAYAAPPDNPFVGAPGRDEIFALGMRNPWRFSFDRATGELWVADVGQGANEEVDAPLVRGGNYGWRVYEGTSCTNLDPARCNPAQYVAPLFEYAHVNGRCSITGGHVYRGNRGALPIGTYVFGDFCTGEILGWNGSTQALLLDTAMSIASFGEDEEGELYVVDIGGTVSRIAPDVPGIGAEAIEYFHAGFGHYFTTASTQEIALLDAGAFDGWMRTGEAFRISAPGSPGSVDVCRFFSTRFAPKGAHFYTPLAGECDLVRRDAGWTFEGIAFAVRLPDAAGSCASGTRPLYRMYNDAQGNAPNHRYATSLDVRATMLAQGWVAEGYGNVGVIACVPS